MERFSGPWGSYQLVPNGDTHVGFDAQGVGYFSTLAVTNTVSGYVVLTTTDGATWSTPVPVVVADYSQSRRYSDLAVDPRSSGPYAGSLYMGWFYDTTYDPYYYGVQLRYSRDGGRNWSNDVQVSDPDHTYTFGPKLVVGQDGTVYAAFEQLDSFYYGNPPNLYLNRSTDGGQTWAGDRLISGAPAVAVRQARFQRARTYPGGQHSHRQHKHPVQPGSY